MSRAPGRAAAWSGGWLLGLGLWTSCASPPSDQRSFGTAEAAGEALITAAEQADVQALKDILGPAGANLVVTEDTVQDRNQAAAFAAQARIRTRVVPDSTDGKRAFLCVGEEEWPLPIPLVRTGGKWWFDTAAGTEEILNRRIGRNELDAIEICLGYVEAQHEYASETRDGAPIRQYAQRIISTPGRQDGLAWLNADSTWGGPVGEGIARVIAEGYTDRIEPYHGYYFKILKGQGPSAPLGELDFLVKNVMIGGFALVAAPAEYGVTGVMTFLVSHDGVVYEKDLGAETLERFRTMERYDPDPTWEPVEPVEAS
jgi:hypothetical protein